MNGTHLPARRGLLAVCHASALLLALSFILPAGRGVWQGLDEGLFRLLNGSLAAGGLWVDFWALANWRPTDLISGGLILLLLLVWLGREGRARLPGHALELVGYATLIVLTKLTSYQLITKMIGFRRPSASLFLPDAIRLSEAVTWIDTKDSSSVSFPGDHAFVILMATLFLFVRGGAGMGRAAIFLLFPFLVPRLVSGAHWLTDILVGSVTLTLLAGSWWFATPLPAWWLRVTRPLQAGIARLLAHPLFARWPAKDRALQPDGD